MSTHDATRPTSTPDERRLESRPARSSTSSSSSATTSSTPTTAPARSKKEIKEIFGQRREYLTIKILHNDMTVHGARPRTRPSPVCAA